MVGTADDDFSFCMKTLLDRLVEGKGVHCGVCMRGEEEITLVRPRRVKELIQYHGFKIFEPVDSSVPWACVLCESAATHALRAHRALRCAARVTALVTDLRAQGDTHTHTGTHTGTGGNNTRFTKEARRVMWRECEAMLRSVRGGRRLVRTDVLVVDSTGVRAGDDAVGHKRAPTKTPSRLKPITPISSEIETVILDDDEDPLAITPAPPALPVLGPPTAGAPSTGNLLQLTPLVSLYNGSNVLYVPQHNNNQNVIIFVDNDCTVQKNDVAQLMLKGTDDGARKRARLGGPGAAGGVGGAGSPGHYVVDIDDVTGMIKEQNRMKQSQDESRLSVPSRPAGKARGTGRGTGTEREAGVERGVEGEREAGRAVPSGARVDWEDKIPMDVISFMDATDPLASELIVPERGRGGQWDPPPGPDPPVIDLS